MFSIYEAGNHLLICADYIEPVLHSHSAAHIIISLENEIRVLIFLFDSTTNIAKQMNEISILDDKLVDGVVNAYHIFLNGDKEVSDYRKIVTSVYQCVDMRQLEQVCMDERVEVALKYVRSNLREPLICSDVAKHVFLSEGRFSHLFKEQVGMTFAAYLIYQRVMKTYVEIIDGKSITEAAIEAGFSSSTHFAETSKRLFLINMR